MELAFSKIHGLGNDFIVVSEMEGELVKGKSDFAKRFCDRHFGIGADGVLFLCRSKKADFCMRIFNSDGGEAENCVNGLRCSALQAFLLSGKKKRSFSIETLAGMANARIASFKDDAAVVEIEFLGRRQYKGKFYIKVDGSSFEFFSVDTGNPHAVFFLKDEIDSFPVEEKGHRIEYHAMFSPARVNAEFVNVISPSEVRMRVHERGACETMACGSGSIAIVVAGVNNGLLEKGKWVSVRQPGGTIDINFGEKQLLLRAEARMVFSGMVVV